MGRCVPTGTEEINTISLSSDDDKKLQTFDKIITYLYRASVFKVCESKMLKKHWWIILTIMQMKKKQNIIWSGQIFNLLQVLINKIESAGWKHFNDPNAFIEYSNDMQDGSKNIEEYNIGKHVKLIVVMMDDMIADMINHEKLSSLETELFISGRKLNISIVFITQSFHEFFYHENSKQKSTSTNCIKSFIRHWF